MYFILLSQKTAFFKLSDVFPECFLYRKNSPQIDPLVCLQQDNICHVGKNCIETLVRRLNILFSEVVTQAGLIVLYFKHNEFNSIGAGIFFRDLENLRIITVNPYSWKIIKMRGEIYEYEPSASFYLGSISSDQRDDIESQSKKLEGF